MIFFYYFHFISIPQLWTEKWLVWFCFFISLFLFFHCLGVWGLLFVLRCGHHRLNRGCVGWLKQLGKHVHWLQLFVFSPELKQKFSRQLNKIVDNGKTLGIISYSEFSWARGRDLSSLKGFSFKLDFILAWINKLQDKTTELRREEVGRKSHFCL